MDPFTAPQLDELCRAIADAFDRDGLGRMLTFKLGVRLDRIVDEAGTLDEVVGRLVARAAGERWTAALVYAVVLVRPDNLLVKAFCARWAAWAYTPPPAAELVARVQAALKLVVRGEHRDAVRDVLSDRAIDFREIGRRLTDLNKYKRLHDRLHYLQKMFDDLLAAAPLAAAPAEELQLHAHRLREAAATAASDARGLPTLTLEQAWITQLNQSAACFAAVPPRVAQGETLLRRALSEGARINAALTAEVRELRLGRLIDALARAGGRLADEPAQVLTAARDALAAIRPRLDGLIEEHFEWQVLDGWFAVAELLTGGRLADRFPGWGDGGDGDVRQRLGRLFDLAPGKAWALALKLQIGRLEAAEVAGDGDAFARHLGTFRTLARDRFMAVDAELLSRSAELAAVAPDLNNLV